MDLEGRSVVVSGGTSGIGRATALRLASRGAEVIVIGRDAAKGAEVETALRAAASGKGSFLQADLSLLSDARRVLRDLNGRLPRLDALIQSAGVIDFEATLTTEGLNKVFVTNFLQRFVLAEGLMPLLATASGRMVMVAADIPDKIEPDWANFEGAKTYSGITSLVRLHSAGLAFVQRFADEWAAIGIEVTAIHPGQVDTGIYRSATGPWAVLKPFMSLFFVPVEKPAALLSWLAFSPEAKGLSGNLFPSVRRRSKHRKLKRSAQTLDRVFAVARATLAAHVE